MLMLLALLSGMQALPQGTASAAPVSSATPVGADPRQSQPICVTVRHIFAKIVVGRGRRAFEITLGGGPCALSRPGVSDLSVRYLADDSGNDMLEAESCPAYRVRLAGLNAIRPVREGEVVRAPAGPFVITDWGRLFRLDALGGRRAAARWLRGTLFAVRGCWNNFREDRTIAVVDKLYARLGMPPPG